MIAAVAVLGLAAPAAASAAWGAININVQTGAAGVGFGEPSRVAAQNEAEKDCPGKCRRAVIVRNKCGAVATNGMRLVPGFGNSKHDAIKRAKKKAGKAGGRVKVVAFVCSG
ncbi:MAG: DUF4189 domain-containing protein [Solirubrobacterales bacterium]|nr:DUF4189 domain-containing protein [Solirubrobacterales bacterium]